MHQVLITRSSSTVKGVKKTTLSRKIEIGQNSIVLILGVMICLVALLYLVHSNQSATQGYAIKVLDQEYDELLRKSEVWNMRNAEAKSMNAILESSVINGMRTIDELQYIVADSKDEG